ncbi:MAG: PhzF family phenazine biosynthesis protein [Candidatus Micrarchaeota archaeon]|nr:PhzF family phenazine biosynthesis protein [Candidatus Micrarchaeota archaeon]
MVNVAIVRAFTKNEVGGNLAGVCLDADSLSDQQMQKIAKAIDLSETAFVQKSDNANFRVRFFTRVSEIALCGHATIATFSLLAQRGIISTGKYTQETGEGVLNVEITSDGVIFMNQALPRFIGEKNKEELALALGTEKNKISATLPIKILSTGVATIIVPMNSLRDIMDLKPDMNKITELTKEYDGLIYAFTTETITPNATAHGRMFDPLAGIPEESATGTANGALACYMVNQRLAEGDKPLVFEQGYAMDLPSELLGRIEMKGNKIVGVIIGGRGAIKEEKEISLD